MTREEPPNHEARVRVWLHTAVLEALRRGISQALKLGYSRGTTALAREQGGATAMEFWHRRRGLERRWRWRLGHGMSSGGAGNCGRPAKLAEAMYGRGRLQLRWRGMVGTAARARLARWLGEVAEAAMSAK